MPLRHIRRCAAAALALGVFAFPSSGFARDGIGRMAPQPGRVVAGSAGNTLTFTFTADSASVRGQTLFAVPNGWTAPQTTDPAGPGYLRIGRRGCAGATRLARIHGQTVFVNTVCRKGASFRIVYSDVTAPPLAAGYAFLTETRSKTPKSKRTPRFLPLAPARQPIVAVIGGPVDHFQITTTSLAAAGTPFSLTVRPSDVYGNIARDASGNYYTPTMSFTSTDPRATLPAPYTIVPADFGTHTFRGLVLDTPGLQTIRVSDQNGITGESPPITVSSYR